MGLDLTSIISSALLSSGTVNTVAKSAKTSKKDTSDILGAALPTLLSSVTGSKSNSTISKLSGLLDQKEEEVEDATESPILTTLLGKTGVGKLIESVAGSLGIDGGTISKVLVSAAPILLSKIMSLVSTDTSTSTKKSSSKSSGSGDLVSSLLGAVTGMDQGTSKTSTKKSTTTKKSTSAKKSSTKNSAADGLVGALLNAVLDSKDKN